MITFITEVEQLHCLAKGHFIIWPLKDSQRPGNFLNNFVELMFKIGRWTRFTSRWVDLIRYQRPKHPQRMDHFLYLITCRMMLLTAAQNPTIYLGFREICCEAALSNTCNNWFSDNSSCSLTQSEVDHLPTEDHPVLDLYCNTLHLNLLSWNSNLLHFSVTMMLPVQLQQTCCI